MNIHSQNELCHLVRGLKSARDPLSQLFIHQKQACLKLSQERSKDTEAEPRIRCKTFISGFLPFQDSHNAGFLSGVFWQRGCSQSLESELCRQQSRAPLCGSLDTALVYLILCPYPCLWDVFRVLLRASQLNYDSLHTRGTIHPDRNNYQYWLSPASLGTTH